MGNEAAACLNPSNFLGALHDDISGSGINTLRFSFHRHLSYSENSLSLAPSQLSDCALVYRAAFYCLFNTVNQPIVELGKETN